MQSIPTPGFHVVPETADKTLLQRPLRSINDIRAIESRPLDQRLLIVDFLRRIDLGLAARKPGDTAIFYVPDGDIHRPAQQVSFQQLRTNIGRTASLLRANGIGRHQAVAVVLPDLPQIYWSILGAMAAGIVFPVKWMLEPHALLGLLTEANVKAIIALGPTPGFKIWDSLMSIAAALPASIPIWSVQGPDGHIVDATDFDRALSATTDREFQRDITGDTIGAYVHSGGTTGLPKIVKLSHQNMAYRHWTLQVATRLFVGEVIPHDTPMFHVGGLMGRCLPPLASGASILIPSVTGARDKRYITNYWKFVEKYRLTRLSGVPTTLAVLAKSPPHNVDLTSLEPYFITGSTALSTSVRQEFERISGVRVLSSYGMTENTASITIDPRDGIHKEGSSGIRLPYTEVRAIALDKPNRHLRLCGPDEIGMLQIRGPGISPEYLNAAHEVGARSHDGWFVTGDLGRIDFDGYVFVTGRVKDIIIRGGHNIDPVWIEEPLLQSPDVLFAAAVGKPDSYAGEVPVAYVQLVPGAQITASDLIAFLADRVAERAALPKEVIIMDKLPLTAVGKPIKAALRRDIAECTFRTVLAEATGLPSADGQLEVSAEMHPTQGVVVSIVGKDVPIAEQPQYAARIKEAMERFAFPYIVGWK